MNKDGLKMSKNSKLGFILAAAAIFMFVAIMFKVS